jgi:hypothetical protein
MQLTSALLSPNSAADLQMTNSHFIELIKELASANNKLKSDLLDCTDLLMECKSDLHTKLDQQEEEESDSHQLTDMPLLKIQDGEETPPSPQASMSTPTVHHHYHYYMRNKDKGKANTKKPSLSHLANNEVSVPSILFNKNKNSFYT